MKLSTHKATTSMIATIHVLKAQAKMDDDTYRDFLKREAGVRTSKDLSVTQAGRVIEKLREATGATGPSGAVADLDGPIGSKLRALWIAGYDLGLVRDRTDRAMLSYLERQTGVSHVRFLADPRDGTKAIEGLKSWLARDGKVEWPAEREDKIAHKRAVVDAQWMRLFEIGEISPMYQGKIMDDLPFYAYRVVNKNDFRHFAGADYDTLQNSLGRKLRYAQMKRAKVAS